MSSQQPYVVAVNGKRKFVCSPVAVMAFIVNDRKEILLMANPDQQPGWQVVNGAMEAEETVLQAVLRETREEAGSDLRVRPLGTVHVSAFHYDKRVRYMLGVAYLLAYEGGTVLPGDDMHGSDFKWWSLQELESPEVDLIIPPGEKWLVARAIDLHQMWSIQDKARQPGFDLSVRGKTKD